MSSDQEDIVEEFSEKFATKTTFANRTLRRGNPNLHVELEDPRVFVIEYDNEWILSYQDRADRQKDKEDRLYKFRIVRSVDTLDVFIVK